MNDDVTNPKPQDNFHLAWECKPQDCWIGVYWKKSDMFPWRYHQRWRWDIWICLVPMLPIHLYWTRTEIAS